jgi:hypothetical protein
MSELKLDYDGITYADIQQIFLHRGWLVKALGFERLEVATSAHGFHVRIKLDRKIQDRDILLAQILLGSDINREIYNFVRIYNGELTKNWNKLYTKKWIMLNTRIGEEIGFERYAETLSVDLNNIVYNCPINSDAI